VGLSEEDEGVDRDRRGGGGDWYRFAGSWEGLFHRTRHRGR